jgi:polar amino acid transport system substrate-binding protein
MLSDPQSEVAPSGKIRAGINFGNTLLANRNAAGAPRGIAVDLAQELAERVGVPLEIVSYATSGNTADGAKAGAWDVAFLATDPDRATEIIFSAPYLEVHTSYLVPAGSPLWMSSDVDREGIRIAVSAKSAYDLFLTRELKCAQLVRGAGPDASVDLFFAERLDALAGLKPLLIDLAEKHPGTRVLDGHFTVVQQAVGVPKGRDAAANYVAQFVADIKLSGLVASLIMKNNIRGASTP